MFDELNKQINELVEDFQSTGCDIFFRDLSKTLTKAWRKDGAIRGLARRYGITEGEVMSIALERAYRLTNVYETGKGDFYRLLSRTLSNACIDELRRNKRHETVPLDSVKESDDDWDLLDYIPTGNAEDEAIEFLQIKNDQRQLVASMLDKAPDKCRQAVEAYIESDFSITDAAKRLGVSYPTAKRRIEMLSRFYSENQYGNLNDYFTVATVPA